MVEFPYREEESKIFGKILRPVARIFINSDKENDWKPALVYIDSGADISLLPKDFGLLLGLDLTKEENEIRGIGEAIVPISLQKVNMRIKDKVIPVRVAIALINEVPYILGRYDFFKLFRITFEEYKRRVIVESP